MDDTQALSPLVTGTNLDLAVSAWIDAKFHKSTSERTRHTYTEIIEQFRAALHRAGLDLDSAPGQVALLAQAFASFSVTGRQVKPSTLNLRLAVLSSFYRYCHKQGDDSPLYLEHNPIERLDRAYVQDYGSAQALEDEDVQVRMQAIDQSSEVGSRDYAILSVLLSTGRRASEVAALQWQHCHLLHDGRVQLTFEHVKGGDTLQDNLSLNASRALLRWLRRWYSAEHGDDLKTLPPESPLGVVLAEHSYGRYGEQL